MPLHSFTMVGDAYILTCTLFVVLPITESAIPGTFFWRPRLGIDLAVPTTEAAEATVNQPTKENLKNGLVVLVDGYQMGMTVIGLAGGISSAKPYPHLNPVSPFYYTNVYRWGLRYASLVPFWAGGTGGHFCETFKVWRRRFYYMDELVPAWMRKLIPFIKPEDWAKEDLEFRRYKAYAESAFGKHYRYPSKHFHNYHSWMTVETEEIVEESSVSRP